MRRTKEKERRRSRKGRKVERGKEGGISKIQRNTAERQWKQEDEKRKKPTEPKPNNNESKITIDNERKS